MRKIGILLLLCLFFLTGCNYTELNELGIVDSMAISKEENRYKVTFHMKTTKKEEESEQVLESIGKSLKESIQNAYLKSHKQVYLSHLETLFLNETITEQDLKELTTYFTENKEIRNNFLVLCLKKENMYELYQQKDFTSQVVDLIKINRKEYGLVSEYTFEDFLKDYYNPLTIPIFPVLHFTEGQVVLDTLGYFKETIQELEKEESKAYHLLNQKGTSLMIGEEQIENITVLKQVNKQTITFNILGDGSRQGRKELDRILKNSLQSSKEKAIDFLGLRRIIYQNTKQEIPLTSIQVTLEYHLTERSE